MLDIRTVLTCIPHFFRVLWASFLELLIPGTKLQAASSDIEAGITLRRPVRSEDKAATLSNKSPSVVRSLAPLSTRADSLASEDYPARPPSKRISVFHPVKSRIVDATLKQVQDKTINVVKAVVIMPCSVTAIPCSAKIEYCEVSIRRGTSAIKLAGKSTSNKTRTVQFVLPPTVLPDFPEPIHAKWLSRRNEDSIDDLFDLFPYPPAHIPPVPPATEKLAFEPAKVPSPTSPGLCSFLATSEGSNSSSEFENTLSTDLSGSVVTDDTSHTSTPGSSDCLDFSCALSSSPFSVIDTLSHGHLFALTRHIDVLVSPELTVDRDEPDPCSTETGSMNRHNGVSSQSTYLEPILETQDRDLLVPDAERSVPSSEPSGNGISPQTVISLSNQQDFVERYHDVVDGSNKAILQIGDIFEESDLKGTDAVDVCQPTESNGTLSRPRRGCPAMDPRSSQLEPSSESEDDKYPGSMASYSVKSRDEDDSEVISQMKALPVTPLRIVKKNKPQELWLLDTSRSDSVHWEESLENVLQANMEAETEDQEFRDLFYRDSSCYSQSSFVGDLPDVKMEESSASSEVSRDEQPSHFDESFETTGKSVEDVLAVHPSPEAITIKVARPASVSLSGVGAMVKKIVQDEVKSMSRPLPQCDSREVGRGREDVYSWIAVSDDEDEDSDLADKEDHDLWSDLFELDDYLTE